MQRIYKSGVIAVMRGLDSGTVVKIARALCAGGVEVLEVTANTPGALRMIEQVRTELGNDVLVGVGTVLDPETARAAIMAGAEFVFTPTVNRDVIALSNRYGKPVIPGAMTPTEIMAAFEAGAPAIKVFPANVLGPEYLRQVRAPLPQVPLIPTGGVDEQNVAAFVAAGAAAVGIGSALVSQARVRACQETGDWSPLTTAAQRIASAISQARRSEGDAPRV